MNWSFFENMFLHYALVVILENSINSNISIIIEQFFLSYLSLIYLTINLEN